MRPARQQLGLLLRQAGAHREVGLGQKQSLAVVAGGVGHDAYQDEMAVRARQSRSSADANVRRKPGRVIGRAADPNTKARELHAIMAAWYQIGRARQDRPRPTGGPEPTAPRRAVRAGRRNPAARCGVDADRRRTACADRKLTADAAVLRLPAAWRDSWSFCVPGGKGAHALIINDPQPVASADDIWAIDVAACDHRHLRSAAGGGLLRCPPDPAADPGCAAHRR